LFDEHVTVCLTNDKTIFSEKVVQIKRIDMLLVILIDAAEGVEHDEGVVFS